MEPDSLAWAKQLQVIAQNGLTYVQDPYDRERYLQVREIAAQMLAAGAGLALPAAQALYAAETGHATPKVDVRGVVFRDDTVLLVRERSDGGWTLPGGWADPGESPAEATVREVAEESGYRTRAVRLLALYDRNRHGQGPHPFHIYKVFFQCELLAGEGLAPGPVRSGAGHLPPRSRLQRSRLIARARRWLARRQARSSWPRGARRPPLGADPAQGSPAHQETDAVDFFRVDALPALSLTRVTPAQIARLFVLAQHPDWPADFD